MLLDAEARIRRTVARQGIPATLFQGGVEYPVQALSMNFAGGANERVAGMPVQVERYALPAYQLPGITVEVYAVLQFADRNRTIKRVDPGYANHVVVRWDVEVEG